MDFHAAYSRIMAFADQFANSSAGSHRTAPPQHVSSSAGSHRTAPPQQHANAAEATAVDDDAIDYAVKEDNYIGDILDNKIVRSCLKTIADTYYGRQIAEIRKEGALLTKDSYPMLQSTYAHCCHTLHVKNPPAVYITHRLRGINALSVEGNDERMILISRRAAISLTKKEQAFILGHELGHHQQGNLAGHTVNGLVNSLKDKSEIFGPMIQDAIDVPLKRWCRRSEFNADRAGLLCCKDMDAVKLLFKKLGLIENITTYHLYKETGEDHPLLITRLQELSKYAKQYDKEQENTDRLGPYHV